MIEMKKIRDLGNEFIVTITASNNGEYLSTTEIYSEECFRKYVLIELAILQKFNKKLELGDMYSVLYDMVKDDFKFVIDIPRTEWGFCSSLENITIINNNCLYEVTCDMSLEELVDGSFLSDNN